MNANKAAQLALEAIEAVNLDRIHTQIVDAAVEGKISVYLDAPLSQLEAYKLRSQGYRVNGRTVSWLEELESVGFKALPEGL